MRISGSIVTLLLLNVDPSSSFTSPAYLPRTFGVKSTDALYFKKGDMTDLSTMEPLLREEEEYGSGMTKKKSLALVRRIWNRLDTMKSSGVLLRDDDDDDSYQVGSAVAPAATQTAADYVSKTSEYGLKPPKPIDPSVLKRSDGGWKGILMFFGTFAGLIFWRWYRSKYIVKTNFWDIQPGLNIVVTSKKQDDELRAYTCKNCKATIFIARNREWYFEGETGLAGLGCFTCGTKGADNFVMDRDRIKEEVGDEDDFWENDRPMDYVQKAEYKVLLKQCGGDKEAALKLMEDKEAKEEALEAATRPEAFAEKYVKDAEVVEDDDGEAGDDGDDGDDDEEYDDDDDDDEEYYDDDEEYDEDDEEYDDEEWEDDEEEYEDEEADDSTDIEASADTTEVADDDAAEEAGPDDSAKDDDEPTPPTEGGDDSMDALGLDDM